MRLGNAAHWFQKNVALLLAGCILSAAIAPGLVFAQETSVEGEGTVNTTNGTFGEGGVPSETGEIGTGGTAEAGGAVQGTTNATPPDQQGGFGYIDLECGGADEGFFFPSMQCVFAHIANYLLSMTASLVGFMGWLLDYAMMETVVQMGENVSEMEGIAHAWQVVRDVSNLIFIFGFLVIGIATILRVTNYGYKTLLRNLIIAAILINFSLLFAKMVIDVSNLMATELFTLINPNPACNEAKFQTSSDSSAYTDCINSGITGIFANHLRITTMYDPTTAKWIEGQGADRIEQIIIPIGFFGSVFFVITAFVFAAGAILLVIRFAVLIILMIFSPIAFAGMVLPQTQKYADDWWHRLFAQSFFAPAYLFMIWLSMVVLSSAPLAGLGGGNFAGAITGQDPGAASVFISFGVAIAFMIASLIVASKLGAYGAGSAIKFGKSMGNNASRYARRGLGAATFGTAAAGMRGTVGRGSRAAADSEWLKQQASQGGLRGFAARATLRTVAKGADASFDARKVGGVGKKLGIGEGAKGGYDTRIKNIVSARQKDAKLIGGGGTIAEERRELNQLRRAVRRAETEPERAAALAALKSSQSAADAAAKARSTARTESYAGVLDTEKTLSRSYLLTPRYNKMAAVAIRKKQKESASDKLKDALDEAVKEAAKGGGTS